MKKDFKLLMKVAVEEIAALASCTSTEARLGLKGAYKIALTREALKKKPKQNWYLWMKGTK